MQVSAIINDVIRMTQAARRLGRAIQNVAGTPVHDACGLNPKELILLRAAESGSAFPHELSDRTDTAAPLVTRAIDRLVELGYVERRPDTVDRRRVALVVTDAGARASADGWTAMREVLAHAFGDVPAGTIARLAQDMDALSRAVEEKDVSSPDTATDGAAEAASDGADRDGAGSQGVSA